MKTQVLIENLNSRKLFGARLISFAAIMLAGYFNLNAQTFPTSCTSKDLELVSATLPGNNPCNTCTPGTVLNRVLNVAINNKTSSTRTSFAFWATLEVYNDNGTL